MKEVDVGFSENLDLAQKDGKLSGVFFKNELFITGVVKTTLISLV
jgi:hypothetical protein